MYNLNWQNQKLCSAIARHIAPWCKVRVVEMCGERGLANPPSEHARGPGHLLSVDSQHTLTPPRSPPPTTKSYTPSIISKSGGIIVLMVAMQDHCTYNKEVDLPELSNTMKAHTPPT